MLEGGGGPLDQVGLQEGHEDPQDIPGELPGEWGEAAADLESGRQPELRCGAGREAAGWLGVMTPVETLISSLVYLVRACCRWRVRPGPTAGSARTCAAAGT